MKLYYFFLQHDSCLCCCLLFVPRLVCSSNWLLGSPLSLNIFESLTVFFLSSSRIYRDVIKLLFFAQLSWVYVGRDVTVLQQIFNMHMREIKMSGERSFKIGERWERKVENNFSRVFLCVISSPALRPTWCWIRRESRYQKRERDVE